MRSLENGVDSQQRRERERAVGDTQRDTEINMAEAQPDVDLFAGMKKKKKKTVTLDVEDGAPEAAVEQESAPPVVEESAPAADDAAPADGDMFADLKKKKKKKKEIPLDLDAEAAPVDGLDMPLKKKKSKKAATDFEKELGQMDDETEAQVEIEGDLGDDVFNGAGAAEAAQDSNELGHESWVGTDRDYQYPELLSRFFTLLHAHNPELAGEKRRYTIAPPQVARDGTKKTLFANIPEICRRMHRQPEHVIQFLFSELGTTGSVDGAQRLVIKGRYTQKQIETVLRKYIVEYVTCKICKSPDTLLGKENRLYFMTCESCGSRRSVSAIKSGFQAQIGKRKLQKA